MAGLYAGGASRPVELFQTFVFEALYNDSSVTI